MARQATVDPSTSGSTGIVPWRLLKGGQRFLFGFFFVFCNVEFLQELCEHILHLSVVRLQPFHLCDSCVQFLRRAKRAVREVILAALEKITIQLVASRLKAPYFVCLGYLIGGLCTDSVDDIKHPSAPISPSGLQLKVVSIT